MKHSCKRCGKEFSGDKDRVFCSRDCARLSGYEALRFRRIRKDGGFEDTLQIPRIMKRSSIAQNPLSKDSGSEF
jgi:hypothetical protein